MVFGISFSLSGVTAYSDFSTYKLELVKEYTGNKLDEDDLTQHGFKGGRSIQHPLKNNVELLNYIDSVFEEN